MGSPLKNLYSPAFYEQVTNVMQEIVPGFKKAAFIKQIHTPEFEAMELKGRMGDQERINERIDKSGRQGQKKKEQYKNTPPF